MNEQAGISKSQMSHDENAQARNFYYKIPKEPGRKSAVLLAILMHTALILFLWFGVRWQSQEPVAVDAEIWDIKTREAAPLPPVSRVDPQPVEPKPQPVPEQKVQEPDPEIALKREREKQMLEKKRIEEQQEKKRKDDLLKEQKKQELAKLEEKRKANLLIEQQRADNLKRLTGQVAGLGDAPKSTGNNRVDPSYAAKIAAKIKSNMAYAGSDNGLDNPTVDFRIELFPDGSLRGPPNKTKPSGVAAFDDAVERAITKSAPYPADQSGKVPKTIPLTYRLKD